MQIVLVIKPSRLTGSNKILLVLEYVIQKHGFSFTTNKLTHKLGIVLGCWTFSNHAHVRPLANESYNSKVYSTDRSSKFYGMSSQADQLADHTHEALSYTNQLSLLSVLNAMSKDVILPWQNSIKTSQRVPFFHHLRKLRHTEPEMSLFSNERPTITLHSIMARCNCIYLKGKRISSVRTRVLSANCQSVTLI